MFIGHLINIPYKTTFIKYCLAQLISKLSGSFEIHWVRQYLVIFKWLPGIVNTTVYKLEDQANFHMSRDVSRIVLVFNIAIVSSPTHNLGFLSRLSRWR